MIKAILYFVVAAVYTYAYVEFADVYVSAWTADWPVLMSQVLFIVVLLPVVICIGLGVQAGQQASKSK